MRKGDLRQRLRGLRSGRLDTGEEIGSHWLYTSHATFFPARRPRAGDTWLAAWGLESWYFLLVRGNERRM
jgi:hypothetical protein